MLLDLQDLQLVKEKRGEHKVVKLAAPAKSICFAAEMHAGNLHDGTIERRYIHSIVQKTARFN